MRLLMHASSRVRGIGSSVGSIYTFSSSVTVRATKIYIKMEEKSQAAEREIKKDEAHEKDARNKRYGRGRTSSSIEGSRICLRHDYNEGCSALHRPVLTYIRLTNTRWTVRAA